MLDKLLVAFMPLTTLSINKSMFVDVIVEHFEVYFPFRNASNISFPLDMTISSKISPLCPLRFVPSSQALDVLEKHMNEGVDVSNFLKSPLNLPPTTFLDI